MKTLLSMCFCLSLAMASTLHANVTGLWILSQEYHVWGWCEGDDGRVNYDITACSPISKMVTTTGTYPNGFVFHPFAQSATDLFYAGADGLGGMEIGGYSFPVQAYAGGTWVFQPTTSALQVIMRGGGFGGHHDTYYDGYLIDLTTGAEVTDYIFYWDNVDWEVYEFDPTHQYKLHVAFSPGQDWGEGYNMTWSAEFEPGPAIIPAPGGFVLAVIGASCVTCLRARKVL